jgi:glycosyltransferase involved in cell wall biosynthesis
MKGYVTTTHGEGFGLPIYEAAYSGLPVVAPNWSGYLDFLRAPYTNEKSGKTKIRSLFLKTRYDLQPVSEESIMKDIILKEASWAYVDEKHFKKNMRAVISSNALYRKEAAILKDYLHATFTPAQIYDRLVGEILNLFPDEQWESSTDDDDDKAFSIFTGEKENETDTSVVMI